MEVGLDLDVLIIANEPQALMYQQKREGLADMLLPSSVATKIRKGATKCVVCCLTWQNLCLDMHEISLMRHASFTVEQTDKNAVSQSVPDLQTPGHSSIPQYVH